MKILNKKIPLINTYDYTNPSIEFTENLTAGACSLRDEFVFNFKFKVWYCLFSCENSFKIYNIRKLVEQPILDKVLARKAFLVLDNALEPFTKSIDSIYENIVIKENIPASQIILLTNMPDAKSYSDNLARSLSQESIQIFNYSLFEQDLFNAVHHIYKHTLPKTLEIKHYEKKFLNFNRRWRLHRPFLMTMLHGKSLLDQGFVSFGPCDDKDSWKHRWPELMHYFRQNNDILEILNKFQSVKNLEPFYLDTDELYINRAVSTPDTNKYYENSYFSVVTETTYFTNEWYHSARFLSEKIFKPIAMKHPFILVSVPRSLEVLKSMGYKTFSPFINEDYDYELDDGKRMLKIVNEIERLCNLNEKELENFILFAREICKHNYNVLMGKKKFITKL